MHIRLDCYLEIERVGCCRLLYDGHGLLPYAIPQVHLLESKEVSLTVAIEFLHFPLLRPKLLQDRRTESLRMDVNTAQHVEVDQDIREDAERIRVDSINIQDHIRILDILRHQFLVLLRLPAVLPVSLLNELVHQRQYPVLVQGIRLLLHGLRQLILFLVFHQLLHKSNSNTSEIN